jgi:hypothetical protein
MPSAVSSAVMLLLTIVASGTTLTISLLFVTNIEPRP